MAMQRTRRQILNILKHRGKATVDELAAEIQLSSVTVRAHLAILEREGLVAFEEVRGAVGRPFYAYFLTDQAEALFPNSYPLLINSLLAAIAQQGGDEAVARHFQQTAERLLAGQRRDLRDKDLPERVRAAAEFLDGLGSMANCEEADGKFLIHQYNCPYIQVARRWSCACDLDLRLVTNLIDAADIERVSRLVEGASCCTYVVTPQADAPEVAVELTPVSH